MFAFFVMKNLMASSETRSFERLDYGCLIVGVGSCVGVGGTSGGCF